MLLVSRPAYLFHDRGGIQAMGDENSDHSDVAIRQSKLSSFDNQEVTNK